jgi:hypothetical protein
MGSSQNWAPGMQAVAVACPRCGGNDARTLRVIHESGTTTSQGTVTGWTQGSGSQPGHLTTFNTTSTHQTAAAKDAAPPRKRRNGVVLISFGLALALIAVAYYFLMSRSGLSDSTSLATIAGVGLAIGVLMLLIGVVLAPRDSQYNSEVFPAAFHEWDHTWACQRCGTRFLA